MKPQTVMQFRTISQLKHRTVAIGSRAHFYKYMHRRQKGGS